MPRDEDIMVRTRTGDKTLAQCKEEGIWVTTEECLVCYTRIYVTLNSTKGHICDFCMKNRRPTERGV